MDSPNNSQPLSSQESPYPENGLILDSDGRVKSGTLKALVERLLSHGITDPDYSKVFLKTFKSFTTLDELFKLLIDQFRAQQVSGLTSKQKTAQERVISTFELMVTDGDILEKEDMYILDRIKAFALSQDAASLPTTRNLVAAIEQANQGTEGTKTVPANTVPPLSPIYPNLRVNQKLDLLDIEPLELARQLTLLESSLYQKIRRAECLERAQQNRSMDGIGTVIQTSNRIADWVANSVMSSDTPHHRATIVKHLISVADHCRILNNFSTMTAISAGLNTPSIQRLKQTWDRVEKQYMDQFSACHGNTDFEKYRLMLESVVPPCVPFIGSFLMALPVFRDGPPSNPPNFIEFEKRGTASQIIDELMRWQDHPFNFENVPIIRDYIDESLAAFTDKQVSNERLWALSMEREPRGPEDKMQKLLKESGFL